MRILYLVPDLFGTPGGIARYCQMVCQSLSQSNANLTVLALHDKATGTARAKSEMPNLDYHACESRRDLLARQAIAALRTRPKVILIGHPNFSFLGWMLARLSGAKLVVFMYGIDVWVTLQSSRGWAFRRADSWVSISHFTAQRGSKANSIALDKIFILPNCLDPRLQPAVAEVDPGGAPAILTVARIGPPEQNHKGHDYVIRALPRLMEKFPTLVYHIVGDGAGREWLEALAAEVGVANAVQFHGVVADSDLAHYYSTASIYVMPSRGEGFGFVFLEAMAYGKPIIAGNQDAAVEVIKEGETGLLVDPTDVGAIAGAIEHLLSDASLRQQMGAYGVETVKREHGFKTFQRTLIGYLRKVVK